ncbi:MAG TPA: capsular biosynthesis protein, partial [Microscillaceae bacterium]|nr:capsular biosynthesis protein [Microscillaceae bacterium]
DGVQTWEEALQIVKGFVAMGYTKLIITPHIMAGFYPNTPAIISEKTAQLKQLLAEHQLSISIEAAAEYYYDEVFVKQIKQETPLLTFGNRYVLFETSFQTYPQNIFETIFALQSQGYQPVLAHPERYVYIQQNKKMIDKFLSRHVLLQLNLNSLAGYYGRDAKEIAQWLLDQHYVHFAGSDCHGERHQTALKSARKQKSYQKLLSLPLLNHQL